MQSRKVAGRIDFTRSGDVGVTKEAVAQTLAAMLRCSVIVYPASFIRSAFEDVLLTKEKLQAWKFQELLFVFHNFYRGPPPFFGSICRMHILDRVPAYLSHAIKSYDTSSTSLHHPL